MPESTYTPIGTTFPLPEYGSENMRIWIEALRSGNYAQGMSELAQKKRWISDPETGEDVPIDPPKTTYCCLGIACELSGEGVWTDDDSLLYDKGSSEYLSAATLAWLGWDQLADDTLEYTIQARVTDVDEVRKVESAGLKQGTVDWTNDGWVNLAALNDGGAPFEFIADLVEENDLRAVRT